MDVKRGLEGMAMLARRAEVQMARLALGEVMVEHGACQRRNQRHNCRKRGNHAEPLYEHFLSHHLTDAIIA